VEVEKVPLNVRDIICIKLFSRTYATIKMLFIKSDLYVYF